MAQYCQSAQVKGTEGIYEPVTPTVPSAPSARAEYWMKLNSAANLIYPAVAETITLHIEKHSLEAPVLKTNSHPS